MAGISYLLSCAPARAIRSGGAAVHGRRRRTRIGEFLSLGVSKFEFIEPPPPNIGFRARLTREQCEPIVAKSTAGIGSLGLHRIQMIEGSTFEGARACGVWFAADPGVPRRTEIGEAR
jgi:hypothetical protein